jgi:hypothetical protein
VPIDRQKDCGIVIPSIFADDKKDRLFAAAGVPSCFVVRHSACRAAVLSFVAESDPAPYPVQFVVKSK